MIRKANYTPDSIKKTVIAIMLKMEKELKAGKN